MKKKLLILICVLTAFFSFFNVKITYAAQDEFASDAYLLIDYYANLVLDSKNMHKRMPIASITKLMTALVIFDEINVMQISLSDYITVSDYASEVEGSKLGLQTSKMYLIKNILQAMLIISGNDCAIALCEYVFGSEESAVVEMNKKASELNLKNTNFQNCTGLSAINNYSSCYDIAIILKELCKNDLFLEYASMKKFQNLNNTNKLLSFEGMIAGKTGTTDEAGYCFTSVVERGERKFISVVLNSKTSQSRFDETKKLLKYGFDNYYYETIVSTDKIFKSIIIDGQKDVAEGKVFNEIKLLRCKSDEIDVLVNTNNLVAPIKKGTISGDIIITKNGIVEYKANIYITENYARASYKHFLEKIMNKF